MRTLAIIIAAIGISASASAEPAMYEASLDILFMGTNVAPTGPATRHFHLPLNHVCNPYFPGGTTCGPTTVENGTPLTGSGIANVIGSGPAAFSLPKGAIGRIFSGAFPTAYPTYIGSFVSGQLYNDSVLNGTGGAGFFSAGAGAGTLTHAYSPSSFGVARVVAGLHQFGGTMGLLGDVSLFRNLYFTPPVLGSIQVVTGSGDVGITPVIGRSNANTASKPRYFIYFDRGHYRSAVYPVIATGFRWTTGAVYAYDSVGRYASQFTLTGYDNRSAMGMGTIQLVTPFLAHWSTSPVPDHVAGVASLRVRFVPEPHATLLLVVGAPVLYWIRRTRS